MEAAIENIIDKGIEIVRSMNDANLEVVNEEINVALNFSSKAFTEKNSKCFEKALIFVDATVDKLWEKLNIGCWKDIPDYLREIYSYACFLKACIQLQCFQEKNYNNLQECILIIIETIDRGLLLGNSFREELSYFASSLCNIIQRTSEFEPLIVNPLYPFHQVYSKKDSHPSKHLNILPATAIERPPLDTFHNEYFKKRIPVKLLKCMDHWPALEKWSDLKYMLGKIGPRVVPIEIGSSYTSPDWSQKLVTIEEFVKQFIIPDEPKQIGYLAQHQLFNQIPELLEDIRVPDYCIFSDYDDLNSVNDVDMNAWFGPSQTVSDLHYDPKHNFLAQVVGKKRILLIDPKWSSNVYPCLDHLLHNTAQIDPENPDFEQYPKLESVEVIECILNEGDMIYIPPEWWHHVRSLSVSFSVSFWWGC